MGSLRDVGLIYGGDSIGVALRQVILNLDARYPGMRFKPSLIGALLGAVGGAWGALNARAQARSLSSGE